LLFFVLVAYLGFKGGGFDPLVHDQVGIAVWWIAVLGIGIGALPRRRPAVIAIAAIGLLAAFVAWTALSLTWTESIEKTSADLARVVGYLGVFSLAVLSRTRRDSQRLVAAVASAIVLVAALALLSRLHPSWFPEANQTARILSDPERLSYPVNYWNALAGLIAIGIPLVLQIATCARSIVWRGLAAAALPALALTMFFTLSRGGMAAAVVVVAIFLALTPDRLPKLLTLLAASVGAAILIAATAQRDAIQHGLLNATSRHQGNELLAITLVVCLAVGLAQVGISYVMREGKRPKWTVISRRDSTVALLAGLVVAIVVAAAINLPSRASNGWDEFKRGGGPGEGTSRLNSVAGQSRYQFWSAAVDENATKPLTGTGSGTFEYWWARNGTTSESVRDTHSLYLQTLGELGIVGLLLLLAFVGTVLAGGVRAVLRARANERAVLAAALAGCTAFFLTAVVDWMWQVPALAVAMLLLAAVLVGGGKQAEIADSTPLRLPWRIGFVLAGLIAIVAIAIPLASTSLVRESEADARDGDLPAALEAARSAQNAQPGAATPRLQQALVLEAEGNLAPAVEAARAATEREPTNWRTWLVLSRIEAERGEATAAVRDFREARSLNPRSPLFER
jgi:hypothetical protein